MSYPIPKFVYNPGMGDVTFIPTYPPVKKQPVNELDATRHDSITSSGIQQSVTERIDDIQSYDFETVPQADLASWYSFMSYALGGGLFYVYPDSTLTTNNGFYLKDMNWKPQWAFFQTFKFTINMRKAKPAVSHA